MRNTARAAAASSTWRLKSGGNRLHGTLYEFMRRNALDANSFQNNAQGAPKDGHYLDQYGGEIDGPIVLPEDLQRPQQDLLHVHL